MSATEKVSVGRLIKRDRPQKCPPGAKWTGIGQRKSVRPAHSRTVSATEKVSIGRLIERDRPQVEHLIKQDGLH